jgi:hypothetical protein
MATTKSTDFPARGKIAQAKDGLAVFYPAGTNYELHLNTTNGQPSSDSDRPVEVTIRVRARKVWTVPSGGNFIAPIFGPPKIIQGRVKWLDERTLVVHAGTNFIIDMPGSDQALDLANGPIGVGTMVNVTAMPGATMEVLAATGA